MVLRGRNRHASTPSGAPRRSPSISRRRIEKSVIRREEAEGEGVGVREREEDQVREEEGVREEEPGGVEVGEATSPVLSQRRNNLPGSEASERSERARE